MCGHGCRTQCPGSRCKLGDAGYHWAQHVGNRAGICTVVRQERYCIEWWNFAVADDKLESHGITRTPLTKLWLKFVQEKKTGACLYTSTDSCIDLHNVTATFGNIKTDVF